MKVNRMDRITDLIKTRITRIGGEAHKQFGKTNPYRQEPIPPKEQLLDFAEVTDEDLEMSRQQFGVAPTNKYLENMNKLLRRYE